MGNKKTFIILIMLVLSMNSMVGAFVEKYPLVPETKGQASYGFPQVISVDSTAFRYFLKDYYYEPPALLTLTNISVSGVFRFVIFYNETDPIPASFDEVVETYDSYYHLIDPYEVLNTSYMRNASYISFADWDVLFASPGNLSNKVEVLSLNLTMSSVQIELGLLYEKVRVAIYYEGDGVTTFNYRVDQLDRFAYLIKGNTYEIDSGGYLDLPMTMELKSFVVTNLTAIKAKGTLTVVILSNINEEVKDNYWSYFWSYKKGYNAVENKDIYYKKVDKDHRDELHFFQFNVDQELDRASAKAYIQSGQVGASKYLGYEPDDNPMDFRLLIYYSGTGKASFTLDVYQYPTSFIIVDGAGDGSASTKENSQFPLWFVWFAMLALPAIQHFKRRIKK